MFPIPTTTWAFISSSLMPTPRPRVAWWRNSGENRSPSGSTPSFASSGWPETSPDFHSTTPKRRGSRKRSALAPIGIAHYDARDRFAEHERLDAAAGDLDFRQLWHDWNPISLSGLANIPKLALYHSKRLHAQSPEPVATTSLAALRRAGVRPVCRMRPRSAAAGRG